MEFYLLLKLLMVYLMLTYSTAYVLGQVRKNRTHLSLPPPERLRRVERRSVRGQRGKAGAQEREGAAAEGSRAGGGGQCGRGGWRRQRGAGGPGEQRRDARACRQRVGGGREGRAHQKRPWRGERPAPPAIPAWRWTPRGGFRARSTARRQQPSRATSLTRSRAPQGRDDARVRLLQSRSSEARRESGSFWWHLICYRHSCGP